MGATRYRLLCRAKAAGSPVLRQTYEADEQVDVLEIITQQILHLRARDISMYRHRLVLDNKPYDILNVTELCAEASGRRSAQPRAAA